MALSILSYKLPPIWFWLVSFAISISGLFILGIKPEFLANYWRYLVGYNLVIIFIGLFYLVKFLIVVNQQKKQNIVGVRFTLNLLKIIPVLTILPIASFYAFSFSTVQDNIRKATTSFGDLNQKILVQVEIIENDLNSFRAQEYLDLTSNVLRGVGSIVKNIDNYQQNFNHRYQFFG